MLFRLGLFLIPFENFFFAPSDGWAAIAPIVFFIYFFSKFRLIPLLIKREKKIILFLTFMICWGLLMCSFEGSFNFTAIKRTFLTLGLGVIFYFSFVIRYILENNNNMKKDIQILMYAYLISMIIGVIQWLSYSYNLNELIKIIEILSKRNYGGKVQFTMTEPSFISLHIYGIILILYTFFKKKYIQPSKLHSLILIFFPILVLLIGKSIRFILDTIIVLSVYLLYSFFSLKMNKKIKLITLYIIILIGFIVFSNREIIIYKIVKKYPRLEKIYNSGLYADASLASRYFRINASVKGYKKNILKLYIGYGIGNISIPLSLGYNEAKEEYTNDYIKEVEALKEFKEYSLFCMYIKIISEYGLIILIILLISLFSLTNLFEYIIICYLLVQFDSYSFYSVWLYFFMKKQKLCNLILGKKTS